MDTIAVQFQYPLDSALPAHVPSFDSSLRALLDSAMVLHPEHAVSDSIPSLQLLMPVELGQPLPRIMILSSLFPCLLVLYLAVVAFNRFHSVPISVTSGKKMTDRLLPQLFLSDRTITDEWTRWMRLVALCVGFALCAASFMHWSGSSARTAIALAGCVSYVFAKQLLRYCSAFLLDVETLSRQFVRRKYAIYYNVLLWLVMVAFVHALYPSTLLSAVFPVTLLVVNIFLLINAISIFSNKMKLYGIFLYFCTLEIMPAACMVLYILRC